MHTRALLPVAVAALALTRHAGAFERQWHAGIDAGFADLAGDRGSAGWGAGGHLTYGLTDAFNAMLDVGFSRHSETDVLCGALGAAYTLDVTRVVPYGGVLVGGYRLTGGVANALGAQLALGVDYQLARSWAVGIEVKWHRSLWTWSNQIDSVSYATAFLRAEYVWGF